MKILTCIFLMHLYFLLKRKNREETANDNLKITPNRGECVSKSKTDQQLCPPRNWVTGAAFPKQESRFVFVPTFGRATVTDLRYLDPGCSPLGIDGLTVGAAAGSSLVADSPPSFFHWL